MNLTKRWRTNRAKLAALADGTLKGRARTRLEAEVRTSPELQAALEEQTRALAAARSAHVDAPAGLRARVEAERRRSGSPRFEWLRLPVPTAVGVAAAIALALAVVVLPGSEEPALARFAALGDEMAEDFAPRPDRAEPTLLDRRAEGLAFPRWQAEFGWRATGVREDDIEGRRATTVFYTRQGHRVAYTIVSGEALDPPPAEAVRRAAGVRFARLELDGRTVVTWERTGQTCLLSGQGVPENTLFELAAWRGGGAVAF